MYSIHSTKFTVLYSQRYILLKIIFLLYHPFTEVRGVQDSVQQQVFCELFSLCIMLLQSK